MHSVSLSRRLTAEALGTALLLAVVVGSGVMGERLAGGNDAVALLGNTMSTGAALVVLIIIFGPLSGAHFNPAVTLVFALRREIAPLHASAYVAVQIVAAILGVWLAHAMFDLSIVQTSQKVRAGWPQALSETVATFGLVATILAGLKFRAAAVPALVGLYITSAYWFTASTSFANPAVTIARSFSDSFAGIAPENVTGFVAAQMIGAVLALTVFAWLLRDESESADVTARVSRQETR